MIFYCLRHTCAFFLLNNLSNKIWFNFRIPSWSIYTIIPFPTCYPTRYPRPIMLEFYHVLALRWALGLWLDQSPQPFDYLCQFYSQCFIWTTTSFNCKTPSMCFHTPLNLMDIHFLRCTHGNEHMKTHDVVHDTFATIAQDVGCHMR